jgi:hypothetical protein
MPARELTHRHDSFRVTFNLDVHGSRPRGLIRRVEISSTSGFSLAPRLTFLQSIHGVLSAADIIDFFSYRYYMY